MSKLRAATHFSHNRFTLTGGDNSLNISIMQFSSMYTNSDPTSQKTPFVCTANSNLLELFRQIIAVFRKCSFVKLKQVVFIVTTGFQGLNLLTY